MESPRCKTSFGGGGDGATNTEADADAMGAATDADEDSAALGTTSTTGATVLAVDWVVLVVATDPLAGLEHAMTSAKPTNRMSRDTSQLRTRVEFLEYRLENQSAQQRKPVE